MVEIIYFIIGILLGSLATYLLLSSKLATMKFKQETKAEIKEQLIKEFKLISNEVVEDGNKNLIFHNNLEIEKIINPFREKIRSLESKISECYDKELRDKISLREELKKLGELNIKLSQEAINLTNALKGNNKIQGNWGEMILESILEKSGLTKGKEYVRQEMSSNMGGARIQPDIIIYLPEQKHIIIDAKLSLKSYELYVGEDDLAKKRLFLKEHIKSIRKHINELAEKNYQSSVKHNSLDFTLMFMPIESSYLLAIQEDEELFWHSWEKKILIVSPSTLHSTLKIIVALWRQEKQNKNAENIGQLSGALYDKFINFLEDMEKIGKSIRIADKSFSDAMQKISLGRGSLVSKLEKIKNLGAKTSKNIPDYLANEANN